MVSPVIRIRVVTQHNIIVTVPWPIVFHPPPHDSVVIRIPNIAVPVSSMVRMKYHSVPMEESVREISFRHNWHHSIHPSTRIMNTPGVSVHPNMMVHIVNGCVSCPPIPNLPQSVGIIPPHWRHLWKNQ